jgi:archaemetzincin
MWERFTLSGVASKSAEVCPRPISTHNSTGSMLDKQNNPLEHSLYLRLFHMLSPQQKESRAPSIGLINMGAVPHTAIRVIAANIQTMLEVPVDLLPTMAIPKEAFQPHRGQHDAGLILKYLAQLSFPHHSRILAVTDVDLCSPILTYVFGEAELGQRLAIASDFRLKFMEDGTPAPDSVYYERLAKVVLHEIAHTFSLYHCETPKCLMRLSPRVSHLDELDILFCERCMFLLHQKMRNIHSIDS